MESRVKHVLAILVFLILAFSIAFAEDTTQPPSNYNNQPDNSNQSGGQQGQGNFCQEPHPDCYPYGSPWCKDGKWVCPTVMSASAENLDIGLPNQSFADPEYVAKQKMIEGMTTAYNWIVLNSTKFAAECKTDKQALITELASVIQEAQDTSNICAQLTSEASNCDADKLCKMFKGGQLPLPQNMKASMKKAGYDPAKITLSDITQEMLLKVCKAQGNSEVDNKKQMIENAKAQVEAQLPAFKKNCEERKKNMAQGGQQIQLPNFNPQVRYVAGSQNQPNQPMQPGPNQPMQPGPNNQPGQGCQEPHPDCGGNGAPFCNNGAWSCPAGPQGQPNPQLPAPQESQPPAEQQPPAEPQPTPEPSPEPPVENPSAEGGVQTQATVVPEFNILNIVTGLFAEASSNVVHNTVCGDGICEWNYGENDKVCQQDCMAGGGQSGSSGSQPAYNPSAYNGPGASGNYVAQGNNQPQNNQPGPGLSPETLCDMSDDEIIEMYVSPMGNTGQIEEEISGRCTQEVQKMLNEISKFKLEEAKCKANAALDCAAKQQAVANCNELKEKPEKAAEMVVTDMCRRFTKEKPTKLGEIADKWQDSDPALANQLDDTTEKTAEDQKQLDIISYFFGNGNYATKLKERATKLREVKDRLLSNNVDDQETISVLDTQISDLETESGKFGNLFDVTRLGYMFRQAPG